MTQESPTFEESLELLAGSDLLHTSASASVPALTLSDGPNGLAMNLPDFSGKVPGTCFPSPGALAATWDRELAENVGTAIAREARAAGADVLLAPSVNIRRSPLGGRGFEYYSEDPTVSGVVGAAFVRGVQAGGVAACVKHFAVNSQETDRMRVSAELSQSALREIYLPAFERIVTESAPAFVMASYNKVNGNYAAQHTQLLTTILRDEWGFEGAVISDWGAVDDAVAAVRAGLDIEMPGPALGSRAALRAACDDDPGLRDAVLQAGRRVADASRRWAGDEAPEVDHDAHHRLAQDVSTDSITLLATDGTLPLDGSQSTIAVVGALASAPLRQGGGSSSVNPLRCDNLLTCLASKTTAVVRHAAGYTLDGADTDTVLLAQEALELAAEVDVVVVVVGSSHDLDTEGRDRATIELPSDQRELVTRLCATATPTVVVINSGGTVITSPWSHEAAALLTWWLPGAGGGEGLARVLTGECDPGGRLTETVPLRLADTPTAATFPQPGRALHAEGSLVGYRWYDRVEREVAFPFGHGTSYTRFAYDDLTVARHDDGSVGVGLTLTNVGDRAGTEVWQVYVGGPESSPSRPVRQLAEFGKVRLPAGARVDVRCILPRRAFERWDDDRSSWVRDGGAYTITVGASSRDLRLAAAVDLERWLPVTALDSTSTLGEWLTHPELGPRLLGAARTSDPSGATLAFLTDPMIALMIGDLPIGRLFGDPGQALTEGLLAQARG